MTTEERVDSKTSENTGEQNVTTSFKTSRQYIQANRVKNSSKKINLVLLWDIAKKHLLTIVTSIITLLESIALIVGLFQESNIEEIGTVITGSSLRLLFLYIGGVILALLSLIFSITIAFKEYLSQRDRVFEEHDKTNIDNYLTKFIESGESVAILTHDMSWINDDNREMLERKAKNRELLLFLPYETAQIKELEKMGADVRYFGKILNDPANALVKSRMTIVNWNTAFPKLTYPIKKDGLHINYEINNGEPANQLAVDLARLLISISEKGSGNASIQSLLLEYEANPEKESYKYLSYFDQNRVLNWLEKYTVGQEKNVKKAFDLMVALSYYEDIDMRTDEEFMRIKQELCAQHQIIPERFLNMYGEYRTIISK